MINYIALYILICWLSSLGFTGKKDYQRESNKAGHSWYDRVQRVLLSPIFIPIIMVHVLAKLPSIIKKGKQSNWEDSDANHPC